MYGKPRDYFFHYTTREAAFAHILPERQLRLSPYSKVNDPMESKSGVRPSRHLLDWGTTGGGTWPSQMLATASVLGAAVRRG